MNMLLPKAVLYLLLLMKQQKHNIERFGKIGVLLFYSGLAVFFALGEGEGVEGIKKRGVDSQ